MDYPGGFITKTAPTLNPALGNAAPGVWRLNDVLKNIKAGTWPGYDPYFDYTTLLLHGNGTNGGQNNTFLDSGTANSGSGFTITRNGNTTQGTFSPFSQTGWSNYFDGSGDYLQIGSSSSLNMNTYCSIEAWVYLGSSGTNQLFVGRDSSYWIAFNFTAIGGTSNKFVFSIYNGSSWQAVSSTTSPSQGVWYHVVGIKDNTTLRIYINGIQENTATFSGSPVTSATPFGIGANQNTENMTGYLSNVRFNLGASSSVLPYTGNFTVPTAPLSVVTGTVLLTCQSNRFVDNSASPFTLTAYGNTSVQAFSPFAPTAAYSASTVGGSGYFDGSGDYLSYSGTTVGASAFTFECWFYITSFASVRVPFGVPTSASSGDISIQILSNQTTIQIDRALVSNIQFTVPTIAPNSWNHLAVVRDGSNNCTVFLNGTRSSSGAVTNTISYGSTATIGVNGPYGGDMLGYLSGARIVVGSAVYDPTLTTCTVPTSPPTNITNTKLLLNFTNAGIFDNTANNDLVTVGNAQISTAQSKFGGGSILFNGTTDFIYGGLGQTWNFLTGPFTVECWIYFNSVASGYVFSNANSSGNLLNGITLYLSSSGTLTLYGPSVSGTATTSGVSTGQWYHLAVTRSGNTFYLFKDGVQQGTFTDSGSITGTDSSRYFGIGRSASYSAAGWLSAYIDEFRITKGIARYTSNFTPQTSQWQDQ